MWVASVDSTRDVPIGPSILAQTFEGLRKIRNTARFMLGNLSGANVESFAPSELGLVSFCPVSDSPSDALTSLQIERYVLNELYELDQVAREAYNSYAFNRGWCSQPIIKASLAHNSLAAHAALMAFSNSTLSSLYFDVTKDSLYADAKSTPRRQQILFTLQTVGPALRRLRSVR